MKKTIIEQVLSELEKECSKNQEAFKTANVEASHAEGAMQSRFSTFKEEAQDLAVAYAKRLNELNTVIANLHRVLNDSRAHSSVVQVNSLVQTRKKHGEGVVYYLILSERGGYSFTNSDESSEICVISKGTHLAKALLGKRVGEALLLHGVEEWGITKVE